jgi:2-amino-4-hydroxy-6-hydroxymethyldihydropteridine diphosphokinase
MARAIIALGANLPGRFGPPSAMIEAGLQALEGQGCHVVTRSRLYRSPAWPDPSNPEFINAAASLETTLPPAGLLARLHAIEEEFGRVRREANAPRTLDLDLLDYEGRVSVEGEVTILPHPRMAGRAFVLLPLADIAPDWRHPVTGVAIANLIAALPAPLAVTLAGP